MKETYQQIDEFIEKLNVSKQYLLQEVEKIETKICGLNELKDNIKDSQKLVVVKRVASISSGDSKFMDGKDITKVNIFLEFLDKCGEATDFKTIRKKMPKTEYYIYNKKARLWNSYMEFKDDYKAWLNREGYWTNAIPKPDNRPDDINYPIMKMGGNHE